MLKYRVHILLITGLILHVMAYSISPLNIILGLGLIKNSEVNQEASAFFALSALAYCTYMLALYFKADTKGLKSIVTLIGSLYISNLLDVLFFNRKDINLNEYIGAIIAAIVSIAQYNNWYEHVKCKFIKPYSTKWKAYFLQIHGKILNSWNK